jgi:hypothetical protein
LIAVTVDKQFFTGGETMRKPMVKSKSFWTGLLTVATSAAGAFGIPVPVEVTTGLLGLLGIFIRMGVEDKK